MKTRSSKRIDEYSSRINMYYLNYIIIIIIIIIIFLLPLLLLLFIQTPVFCFSFFFSRRFLTANCLSFIFFLRLETAAYTPQKIILRANGNVCTTYSSRSDSSIVEHTFASQRIYLSQIHVFDIDSYTLLIVIV